MTARQHTGGRSPGAPGAFRHRRRGLGVAPVTGGLIALLRAMFTVRPLLLAGVLYVVFAAPEPPWYVPVQLLACVLLAYVLLCGGRDLRARAARRLGRSPGVIHHIGRWR